jgi:hypothetical protein
MARELKITYGTASVGVGTSYPLLDKQYEISNGVERGHVSFTFAVSASTEANFATACNDIEAAFAKRNQDVSVVLGSSTVLSYSHSGNTGFNSRAEVEKHDEEGNSGRSRRYHVRIEYERPASDASGRRDSSVRVETESGGRRIVSVSGVWTALSTSSAWAQYNAQIASFCSAVMTALGITYWEKVSEPQAEYDFDNKLLRFSREMKEIIWPQLNATYDDSAIIDPVLSIQRKRVAPGDYGIAVRLAELTVTYSCWIDKSVTTNLDSKWSSIKTYLVGYVKQLAGADAVALVDESPSFDPISNRIMATMEIQAVIGGKLLECREETEDYVNTGVALVPAWKEDKENLSKYRFQGPGTVRRVVRRRRLFQGNAPDRNDDGITVPQDYVMVECRGVRSPQTRGLTEYHFDITEFVQEAVMEKYHDAKGGGYVYSKPSPQPAPGGGKGGIVVTPNVGGAQPNF